jgi:hypothetical protein
MLRIKAIFGVVGLALAVAVVGCGGGSSSDDKRSNDKPAAGDPAKVQKLLEQTFGPNSAASSGLLSGTIDIAVKGVPRFKQPIQLSVSGPFRQDKGDDTPKANLSMGIELRDKAYGAEMILVGDTVLIGLGTTAYQIPAAISTRIRKPLRNSDNALGAVLAVFGIAPRRWAKAPRIVGNETIAGVDVIHGTAGIHAKQYFLDVAKFANVLTSLRFTEIAGLPQALGPKVRAALVRSVKTATGDVYTGAKDHVMRKAKFNMTLKPSSKDRKLLGGISSLKLAGDLNVTEVGSPQKIAAPTARGSYPELQVTLDALAESVRADARQGK